jgi:hypothetical protein
MSKVREPVVEFRISQASGGSACGRLIASAAAGIFELAAYLLEGGRSHYSVLG